MQLLPLIFGIVFLPKACTLKCYECESLTSETCKNIEVVCPPSADRCAALRLMSYMGTAKLLDLHKKSCFWEDMCGDNSFNLGLSRHVISTKCCPTDLCNTNKTSEPSRASPNGKQCYQCIGNQCSFILNCEGNEDYCITTKVKKMKMKGCASKLFCYGAFSESLHEAVNAKYSCCQGDLCNNANSTRAGLLLLVALYVSLITFF